MSNMLHKCILKHVLTSKRCVLTTYSKFRNT